MNAACIRKLSGEGDVGVEIKIIDIGRSVESIDFLQ